MFVVFHLMSRVLLVLPMASPGPTGPVLRTAASALSAGKYSSSPGVYNEKGRPRVVEYRFFVEYFV